MLGFGNGGVVWAEQTVPSGLTAVLVATSPFWMVGIDALLPGGERLTARRSLGLAVGFGGIVMLVARVCGWAAGVGFLGRRDLVAVGVPGVGAFFAPYAALWGHGAAKDENVLATAAFEMLFGGIGLLIAGMVTGEPVAVDVHRCERAPHSPISPSVGAIGGFTAYAYALEALAGRDCGRLYAYVNPVIAVALGTLVLNEPFSWRMAVAAAVVLAGDVQQTRPPETRSSQMVRRSNDSAPADQSHQEQHDGDDQQHVDEVAQCVAAHDAEQPQHDQNDRDGFQHAPTMRQVTGLLVGFGGIVVLVWPEVRVGPAARGFLGGIVSSQLACFGWAVGSTYARRHAREENVLANAALQMLFGGLILLAAAVVSKEWTALRFNPRTAGALTYLTLVGGVGGFSAYAYALKHLPVSTVSLYAYVNPVIAVVLGTLVLKEPFSVRMAVAAGVVLLGMALVRDTRVRVEV